MTLNIPCRSNPMPYYVETTYYSTMPLTFKSTGTTTITFNKTNVSNYPVSGSKDGVNWASVNNTTNWTLNDGEFLYLTGNCQEAYNYDLRYGVSIKSSGNGTLELYGNIMSLSNWRTQFASESPFGQLFNGCSRLVDASKLYLPVMTLSANCYRSLFYGCSNLVYGPLFPAQSLFDRYNQCGYDYMFYSCSNLSSVQVGLTSWGNNVIQGGWMTSVNRSGIFIKPIDLEIKRGTNYIPNNFTVLNRIGKNLFYAQQGDGTNVPYTGDDPYAWYYK